jgi:hypothetical protein
MPSAGSRLIAYWGNGDRVDLGQFGPSGSPRISLRSAGNRVKLHAQPHRCSNQNDPVGGAVGDADEVWPHMWSIGGRQERETT